MLNWKRTPGTVKKRDRGEVTVKERRRERKRSDLTPITPSLIL